jgi:hypothetical protein
MSNFPLELIDLICEKIDRKILGNLSENSLFFSLNEKRLQKYWKQFYIFDMIKIGDLLGVKYLISINKDKIWPIYNIPFFVLHLEKIQPNIDKNMLLACFYGKIKIVKYLVSLGANITTQKNLALTYACPGGNLELVKYLISLGADPLYKNNDPIVRASGDGHLEIVKYLISLGADPLAQKNSGIGWASQNGHLEMVKYLVSLGADISAYKYNAIVFAGNLEILKYFVSIGIDILPHAERILSQAYLFQNNNVIKYIKNLQGISH